jgi:hypothetical protein
MAASLSTGIDSSCMALTIVFIGAFLKRLAFRLLMLAMIVTLCGDDRVGVLRPIDAECLSRSIINLSTPALIIQALRPSLP